MGWTYQRATFYDRMGRVDRKAECDALYTYHNEETGDRCRVLKSAMVGSTWYGACERTRPNQAPYVFAGVCLTHVFLREYDNFGYKDMDESMGPCERDCPLSILALLSPRDDEYALAWREDCRDNAAKKVASRKVLRDLPLGAKVTVIINNLPVVLEKTMLRGRSRPVWIDWDAHIYYRPSQVVEFGYTLNSEHE